MSNIVFEPAKYYDAVVQCITDTSPTYDGEPCPNYGTPMTVTELYSNGGTPGIQCGLCGQPMDILSATLMDPQPDMA